MSVISAAPVVVQALGTADVRQLDFEPVSPALAVSSVHTTSQAREERAESGITIEKDVKSTGLLLKREV